MEGGRPMEPWRSPAEFRKLAAAFAAVVAVSGCGGDDDDEGDAPSTGASTAEEGQAGTGELPTHGQGVSETTGAYVGKLTGDPDTFASVTTLRTVEGDGEGGEFAAVYLC